MGTGRYFSLGLRLMIKMSGHIGFIFILFYFILLYECFASGSVPSAHALCHRDQKRALDCSELELDRVVDCYVGAGNRTSVPCRSSACF